MNLPKYANYLMDLYHKRATIELTMDYYTFSEMMQDYQGKDEELMRYSETFNKIVKENILNVQVDESREKAIQSIENSKNLVFKKVDILAAYADIFSRYEYVSNRVEHLFSEIEQDEKYTDEYFTREIMQFIFSEEDNSAINEKISEIIEELPLRMTKSKFFSLLDEGLYVYSKTDKQTIDDFIYGLNSCAVLLLPEDMVQIV